MVDHEPPTHYELPQRSVLCMPMPGDRLSFYPPSFSIFEAVVVSVKYDATEGWVKLVDLETKQVVKVGHMEFRKYAMPK